MADAVGVGSSGRTERRGLLAPPRIAWQDYLTGYLFLLPALAGLLLFSVVPLFYALFISLHYWDTFRGALGFVGLENYQALLGDATFWRAMRNTAYYALWQVPLQSVLALGLAMLIQRPLRGIGFFRAAYYLPVVISMVVASALWRIILDSESGLVNSVLAAVGLPRQPFLLSPTLTLPTLGVALSWKWVGFSMMVFLAGLQAIPRDYYEAAQIDGASAWQSFWRITLPLLRRPGAFVVVTTSVNAFKLFTPIYIITQGGPQESTTTIVYEVFQNAFRWNKLDVAAAMGFALLLVLLLLTAVQLRWLRGGVEY
ncbi:MAG TPA: sugar ABC transporter permease [Chloroflexota bacterium]|nr:sugar ABC transporter permease [Chloroflexota bacterium]